MENEVNSSLDLSEMEVDNEEGLTLMSLPSVVLLKIFSYLTQHDILHSLAPACQDLYELSKRPNWHMKVAINHRTEPEKAKEFIRRCRNLRELHFSRPYAKFSSPCVMQACDEYILAVKDHEFIEVITMDSFWFLSPDGYRKLVLSKYSGRLNYLDAAIDLTAQKGIPSNLYIIPTSLRHMNIRSVKQFSRESVVHLIHRSEKLKTFVINWRPRNEDLVELVTKSKTHLESLELMSENLTDDYLCELSKCTRLTHLNLKNAVQIGVKCLQNLAIMKNLTSLELGAVSLEATLFVNAFTPPNFKNLQNLHVQMDNFNDNCARAVGRSCTDVKAMQIYSTCNDLTSFGVESIFENCAGLISFHLESLTDKSIDLDPAFLKIWNPSPRLEQLVWSGRNLKHTLFSVKMALQRSNRLVAFDRFGPMYVKRSMAVEEVAHMFYSMKPNERIEMTLSDIVLC